jgi:hypothetical protein
MLFGSGQLIAAVMALGHDFFSSHGLPEKSGGKNLPLLMGNVINYSFAWQTVSNTVFGFRFSVFG